MAAEQDFSWRRSIAWAVALALHVAALGALTLPIAPLREPVVLDEKARAWVAVEVVDTRLSAEPVPLEPAAHPPDLPPPAAAPARRAERRPRRMATSTDNEDEARTERSVEASAPPGSAPVAPVPRTIAYLDDDARARLPEEARYSATPPPREGDYFTPGDGREDDVFYRPRALDPRPSRFAQAWRPSGTAVDDWLGRLVEKTTGKVSVPLNAKFSLVCVASAAGLGGGCAIVRNGGTGVIVERPPPAPWERSNRVQCRELRAALESADEVAQVAYFIDRLAALCSGPVEGNQRAL